MQTIFPEGHLFMNVLYGLTQAENASGKTEDEVKQALGEVEKSLARIYSPEGRAVFNAKLPLSYGVFYRGWSGYLLGKKVTLSGLAEDEAKFQLECDAIALAFERSASPWLESYGGLAWPADNVVAIAALATYDRLFETSRYRKVITDWLEKAQNHLDPKTGLIPHAADPRSGEMREGARGSSQSLMLSFMPEIDSAFARQQYGLYKQYFLEYRLGRAGIREYPKGTQGAGDVDSGPVIWGIGGSASVVGQRAAGVNGDMELFADIRGSLQAFGLAYSWRGKKRYLFGQLPVADAFIAWCNSLDQQRGNFPKGPPPWRIHLICLPVVLLVGWTIRKI